MNSLRCWLLLWIASAALWLPAVACAAPDDVEAAPAEVVVRQNFGIDESNFDQWVFQGTGNADATRKRLKLQVNLQIDEIDRACSLTEPQKQKLLLAASGDTKRIFDQVEVLRQKFLAVKNDQNGFNQIWQEINPIQMKFAAGIFGETSFFAKTVRSTLTAEQAPQYKKIVDSRRRYRYRAAIEASLVTLQNSVPLRSDQHEALAQLVLDSTQPPHTFGQYGHYLVMYNLSQIPADRVKPLLDDRQWKLLNQQFNQFRGMKQWLIQNGMIPKDGEEAS